MKPTVECNICYKQGDGYWASWHRREIGHNSFTLLYGEEDEPPQSYMGFMSRFIPPNGSLARRFKGIRELWASDWCVPPNRDFIFGRCVTLFKDI